MSYPYADDPNPPAIYPILPGCVRKLSQNNQWYYKITTAEQNKGFKCFCADYIFDLEHGLKPPGHGMNKDKRNKLRAQLSSDPAAAHPPRFNGKIISTYSTRVINNSVNKPSAQTSTLKLLMTGEPPQDQESPFVEKTPEIPEEQKWIIHPEVLRIFAEANKTAFSGTHRDLIGSIQEYTEEVKLYNDKNELILKAMKELAQICLDMKERVDHLCKKRIRTEEEDTEIEIVEVEPEPEKKKHKKEEKEKK